MTSSHMHDQRGDDRRRDDHFFLATQRWLLLHEVASVQLVCHGGQSSPLGMKGRPAIETPGCLRDLALHRLVDLSLAGVRAVAVVAGPCCADVDPANVIAQWSVLRNLVAFTTAETTPARNWTWSVSPSRVPVDRRGLLGLSRHSQPPWPIHDDGADDHARLLTSLRAAGVTSLETATQAVALVASGCTACGVCVAACPHDALTLHVDGTETSLLHSLDACWGEQQCVELCPVSALTTSAPLSWAEVLEGAPRVLATLQMAVCERCQAPFPAGSGAQWCEPCRIRRSDPFGSHLSDAAIELLRTRGHDNRS